MCLAALTRHALTLGHPHFGQKRGHNNGLQVYFLVLVEVNDCASQPTAARPTTDRPTTKSLNRDQSCIEVKLRRLWCRNLTSKGTCQTNKNNGGKCSSCQTHAHTPHATRSTSRTAPTQPTFNNSHCWSTGLFFRGTINNLHSENRSNDSLNRSNCCSILFSLVASVRCCLLVMTQQNINKTNGQGQEHQQNWSAMSMLTATAHIRKSRKSNPKKDEDILKERFSMSFLGDYPSFHIARTMAEESSKNHEELVVSASTTWDRTNKCQSSNMHSLSLSSLSRKNSTLPRLWISSPGTEN